MNFMKRKSPTPQAIPPEQRRIVQAEARIWATDLKPLDNLQQQWESAGEWNSGAVKDALANLDISELRRFLLFIGEGSGDVI
jgi:muconolactone delta-isomerase